MRAGQHGVLIERKTDHTPVTEIDRRINEFVISEVSAQFPEHGILGEEESFHNEREWLWVCDPIDGTFAFITGVPTSAFSLALAHHGEVVIAVVYNPWSDQLFSATKNGGAFCNDLPLQVSRRGSTDDFAFIGATGSMSDHASPINSLQAIKAMTSRGWKAVNFPGVAYKACLVATGQIDGAFYNYKSAHDIAAVSLIVTEAGGKVTDVHGQPQRFDRDIRGAVISNGLLHDDLVAFFTEVS